MSNESKVSKETPATSTPTPKRQNKKAISLSAISKEAKQVNTYSEHVWDAETNTVIKYYERFDKEKIDELLEELYDDINEADKNETSFFHEQENFMKYIYMLIVKKFTHLNDSIPKELDRKIAFMREIRKIGLAQEMVDNVFDPEEVYSVIERVTEISARMESLTIELEKEQSKMKSFLDNSDNIQQLKKLDAHKGVIHPIVDPTIQARLDAMSDSDGNV